MDKNENSFRNKKWMFKANQNARRDYSSLKRDCFFAFKMFFFCLANNSNEVALHRIITRMGRGC